MPDFGVLQAGQRWLDEGTDTTTSLRKIITGGAANTKGSYTQLVASTTFAADALLVSTGDGSATVESGSVDIAVGAGGSEVVIAPDLPFQWRFRDHEYLYLLPIGIPAGTRIAARLQDVTGGLTMGVGVHLIASGFASLPRFSRVTTYGFTAASSAWVQLDPGVTPNTKGSWVQIVASSTNPIKLAHLMVGQNTGNTAAASNFLIDLGVGAGGSEVVIVPNLAVNVNTAQTLQMPTVFTLPLNIPAGTRIAVRAQSTLAADAGRILGVGLVGVD